MEQPTTAVKHPDPLHHELRPYQLFMFGLGVYVLLSLAAQTFLGLNAATDAVLDQIDQFICLIFFVDFWVNLISAHDRIAYLKWGWLDLLSSLPMFDIARASRLARVIRVLRALRGVRSARFLSNYLLHRRADGAFFALALLSILLVLFSSISILQFETAPESNIRTPQDALWWAFSTITTVGYGDKFPITPEGRMIAVVLMTAGVGLFGSVTGLVASWLLVPGREHGAHESGLQRLDQRLTEIQQQLQRLGDRPADCRDLERLQSAWPDLPPDVKTRIISEINALIKRAA